nr:hypothetical protein Iba_chr05cCG9280 [Ipomoea batatas]GMD78457.1 hypothetical protein Iba_chr13cCG13200 [Ipomoea batatas]
MAWRTNHSGCSGNNTGKRFSIVDEETVGHVFLQCEFATRVWDAYGWRWDGGCGWGLKIGLRFSTFD